MSSSVLGRPVDHSPNPGQLVDVEHEAGEVADEKDKDVAHHDGRQVGLHAPPLSDTV